ncbi:MAG: PASTA domain-containing protein [Deltaproteobacteria bacterium]|nr:PASTA domain-containing protein [Deltaproteobacteria bacterium]
MTASSDTRATRVVAKRIAIPDVIGLHVDNAKIVLKNAGFERFRVHYVEDYADEFSVVEQFPRSGLLVVRDAEVLLKISRASLVNHLPQVYQQSEVEGGGNFLRGFLNIVQTVYDSIGLRLRTVHELFDPRTTDPDFLPWLGSWLAISLNPDWDTLQRRKMLMAATSLFPYRGTTTAIREFVRIYVGAKVEIEENSWPFQGFRIGVHSTVGDDTVILPPMNLSHCFVVRLDKPASRVPDDEIVKIHQIIAQQKPAHTSYFLAFSDEQESGQMGAFMAIGVAPAEVIEGAPPPVIGMGIGIGGDGTIYEGEGQTGLIISTEPAKPQDGGGEGGGEGGAAGGEPQKKQPKLRVGGGDKGEGGGEGG